MNKSLLILFFLPAFCYAGEVKKVLIKGPAAQDLYYNSISTENIKCYEFEIGRTDRTMVRKIEFRCELKVTHSSNVEIDESDNCHFCRPRSGIRN